jgi:hypothetical protein
MNNAERVPTEEITASRLKDWAEDMNKHHAAPMCLIGCGHDEEVGEIHVCVTRGLSFTLLADMLEEVIRVLRGQHGS